MKIHHEIGGLSGMQMDPLVPMGYLHEHPEVEVNFVQSGELTYLHNGTRHTIVGGNTACFWGSTPHSVVHVAPYTKMAWITIPLPIVLQWNLAEDFQKKIMAGEFLVLSNPIDETSLKRWMMDFKDTPKRVLIIELEAFFLRAQQNISLSRLKNDLKPAPTQVAHTAKMTQFIARHFQEAIGIPNIAAAAGLHPKYAMSIFKKTYGLSLHHYLLNYRLSYAKNLLISTNNSVLDIAYSSGFSSCSSFYEFFKRETHTTPRTFRNAAQH